MERIDTFQQLSVSPLSLSFVLMECVVQAVAIASVMKQFTDQGITVWLRFGHESESYPPLCRDVLMSMCCSQLVPQ